MPKIKSNRAARKRFSKTASGGIKRNRAYHGHLLTSKSRKRKRKLRGTTLVSERDAKRIRKLLPGSE